MSDYEKRFRDYLRKQGLRFTPERQIILKEVVSIRTHFEADDLLVRFRNRGERISRASIFRTLKILVNSGLLSRIAIAENRSYYEHIFGREHHDHMICMRCGKIIEFNNSEIEHLQDSVCREYGFLSTDHILKISGYCSMCQ